eukprot:CAMPEP_0196661634 /NCGR_PEP_ID=MMETSP1086-20130531/45303_1 /TAXON_ID=77921 /ORGANISM="Cyanoptyche  gloeocystis , Strain SAG4.97" /LENGTH=165 /DNA_ID=CAMNT_0041996631 /DNA_START=186 /DNA_END=683 /DNA_ORIENTATION=-
MRKQREREREESRPGGGGGEEGSGLQRPPGLAVVDPHGGAGVGGPGGGGGRGEEVGPQVDARGVAGEVVVQGQLLRAQGRGAEQLGRADGPSSGGEQVARDAAAVGAEGVGAEEGAVGVEMASEHVLGGGDTGHRAQHLADGREPVFMKQLEVHRMSSIAHLLKI